MKIHFHANCQAAGLRWFFDRSPSASSFTTDCIQNFQIVLGEESRERERQVVETADILFYHATKRVYPWPENVSPREGCELIPLSVYYQGAFFCIEQAHRHIWEPVIAFAREHGVDAAVHHFVNEMDIGYKDMWNADVAHMMTKEIEEGVPMEHRISHWQPDGLEVQQLITKNHPTSIIFLKWANLLLKSLGKQPLGDEWDRQCRDNYNIVNLPCEDWVTTAARKHLGMKWGASDYMNNRAAQFAKEKLIEFTQ